MVSEGCGTAQSPGAVRDGIALFRGSESRAQPEHGRNPAAGIRAGGICSGDVSARTVARAETRSSPSHPGEAPALLERRSQCRLVDSSMLLGVLARDGKDVPRDASSAYFQFRVAVLEGGDEAEKRLKNDLSGSPPNWALTARQRLTLKPRNGVSATMLYLNSSIKREMMRLGFLTAHWRLLKTAGTRLCCFLPRRESMRHMRSDEAPIARIQSELFRLVLCRLISPGVKIAAAVLTI